MRAANIQRFSMKDGPGIRTTVFFKGCPLRCAWCHNPETQSGQREILFYAGKCILCGGCSVCPVHAHSFAEGHLFDRTACEKCGLCAKICPTGALESCGAEYSAASLLALIKRDASFYGTSGGVTLSGGEPFFQAEEALRLLLLCRENGINTAAETCGYFSPDVLREAVPLTDLFLWDLKDTDPQRHQKYTGVSNEKILQNLFLADKLGARTRLRCILVNSVNTVETHYENVLNILRRLDRCEGIELIPYHAYGGAKSLALGRENSGNDSWVPEKEQLKNAREYFAENGAVLFE